MASLFEQLSSSVSIPVVAIVSGVTLAVVLLSTIAFRILFSSPKEPTSSKSLSSKEKKPKEANAKKQQQQAVITSNNKKTNNKTQKNVNVASPSSTKDAASSSGEVSQSEESEPEKVALVQPTKKTVKSNKLPVGNNKVSTTETTKSAVLIDTTKTISTKQQVSGPNENIDGMQSRKGKKKQSKPAETSASAKQQAGGKGDTINKTSATNSNKKQVVTDSSEVKGTSVDNMADSDHEDEGQWVTQGNKQVNNRNRNKPKAETSNNTKQETVSSSSAPPATKSPSSSNRKTAPEKPTAPTSDHSPSNNKNESDADPTVSSNVPAQPPIQEPIELCQLLPVAENRYTATDDWWKQALNKQQTFSIDDIGEWPEREQDEQYVVQVKHIIPTKNFNNVSKSALTEKDINISENEMINNYRNAKENEKPAYNEHVNSSSVITGEFTTKSQSKKKSTNIRRLS